MWTHGFLLTCMLNDIPSLSDSSSARFLVPSTFLRVVWASSHVDECALCTLATDEMGHWMWKYTTPSTHTVTESLVRICKVDSGNCEAAATLTALRLISACVKKTNDDKNTSVRKNVCVWPALFGGISKVIVLRSTFTTLSVQGTTKKSPARR